MLLILNQKTVLGHAAIRLTIRPHLLILKIKWKLSPLLNLMCPHKLTREHWRDVCVISRKIFDVQWRSASDTLVTPVVGNAHKNIWVVYTFSFSS